MNRMRSLLMMGLGVCLPLASVAKADEASDAKHEMGKAFNIDAMMAQAVSNISRRYNLNEEQQKQTRELLVDEVGKFLDTHPDIWPLVRDLSRMQREGKAPSGEIARKLGEAALPILEEAQEAILNGNEKWRGLLTEEQKKLHDYDLQDMDKTFRKMEDNFNAMAAGEPRPARLFPEPNDLSDQPRRPPNPGPKFKPALAAATELPYEHAWDRYVRKFIQDYNLDDAQSESALSSLRECKARARDYEKSKEAEFAKADEMLKDARRSDEPEVIQRHKIRRWKRMDQELRQPIQQIFEDLQKRLERLPTPAQRKRAEGKVTSPTGRAVKTRPAAKSSPVKPSHAEPATEKKTDSNDAAPTGEKDRSPE